MHDSWSDMGAAPAGINCQKNAVVCEGYLERVVWKSGRQRAEEGMFAPSRQTLSPRGQLRRSRDERADKRIFFDALVARAARAGTRPQDLPLLVDGIETDMDRYLLDHFARIASRVLALLDDDKNPFKILLLPMAIRNKGLMHSLLCFSGSHMASVDQQPVCERQVYHYHSAIRELRADRRINDQVTGKSSEPVDDPTVAAALVLCLDTIVSGSTDGQYRPHLEAAKYLIKSQPMRDRAFAEFLIEFFTYHDTVSALTNLNQKPSILDGEFQLPGFIIQRDEEDHAFLGVFDGLFEFVARVTKLRSTIRMRRDRQREPLVDYQSLSDAVSLDWSIRTWVNTQRPETPRYIAAQLYRQCTWIYLWRTIYPSRSTPKIIEAVDEGLTYLRQLPPDASTQSILLMPVFILGCAAFEPEQRPELRRAFGTLKRYSNFKNIEAAREVVEKVWLIMDAEDERSWDWEAIIDGMGYDFLVT